ncbi:hypothetical protein HQ496_04635 [bacterium]|nr:hypothetical protein [bacterium]
MKRCAPPTLNWCFAVFGLAQGFLLVPGFAPVFGQSASEDSTGAFLETADFEDVAGEDQLTDVCDLISCQERSTNVRFMWGMDQYLVDPTAPNSSLGGPLRTWLRFDLSLGQKVQLEGLVSKDAHEPFYFKTREPWLFAETKRLVVSLNLKSASVFAGDFRVLHGIGLVSGSGWRPLTSMTSPTRLHGTGGRVKSGVSGPGLPTRRGVAVLWGLNNRLRFGLWGFRLNATASTMQGGDIQEIVRVSDISSTTVFSSESALSRRGLIKSSGLGSFISLDYAAGVTSLYFERVTQRPEQESLVPNTLELASLFTRNEVGRFSSSTEVAFIGLDVAALTTKVRFMGAAKGEGSSQGNSEVSGEVDYQGTNTSPFGQLHRFFATPHLSLSGFYRSKLANRSSFSIGTTFKIQGSYSELDKRKSLGFKAYYETQIVPSTRLSSLLKHTLTTQMNPVVITTETARTPSLRKQSSIQVKIRNAAGGPFVIQAWVALAWRDELRDNLVAAGGTFNTRRSSWNASVSLAIGHQHIAESASIPVYFSDTYVLGRFPVASAFSSFTSASISFSYSWGNSYLEMRFKEVTHPITKPSDTALKQLVQFQYSYGWN